MSNPEASSRRMAVPIPSAGKEIATLLKRGLSASIARYRYQARYFNGQPDGKIEVVPRETKHFQAITSAGNYRVGVSRFLH
jgi:hypothetical protein